MNGKIIFLTLAVLTVAVYGQASGGQSQSSGGQNSGSQSSGSQSSGSQNSGSQSSGGQSSGSQSSGGQSSGGQSSGGQSSGDQSSGGQSGGEQVDFDAVFKSLHLDMCTEKCVEPLKPALSNLLKMTDVYQGFENLCGAYNESLACQKKGFCVKNPIFAGSTSGIEDLCMTKKRQYVKDNEECIKPKIDGVCRQCNDKCGFVREFAAFSNDPQVKKGVSILQTVDRLNGLCESLNCYLPCVRAGLDDDKCPTAGGVIASAILKPFYNAAEAVSKLAPSTQQLVSKKLPQSCSPLINATVLNEITGPSNFRRNA